MPKILNNVNMDAIHESQKDFEKNQGHKFVEKKIEGIFRLEGSPAFSAELKSDHSSFTVSADEPKLLGGCGVHTTPLSYLLFGVMACFANTLAIQCALNGVVLNKLKLTGHLYYDVGPVLTDTIAPMINELKIEIEADREIGQIIEIAKRRCPALYAISQPIKTSVLQTANVFIKG